MKKIVIVYFFLLNLFSLNPIVAQKEEKKPVFNNEGLLYQLDQPKAKKEVLISKKEFESLKEGDKNSYNTDVELLREEDLKTYTKELEDYFQGIVDKLKETIEKKEDEIKDKSLNKVDEILSSLPYSLIGPLGFAQKPLSSEQIKALIPEIKEITADNNEEWSRCNSKKIPAWTRHEADGNLKMGVILNVAAIRELMRILESSEIWRMPEVSDIESINKFLASKGLSAFDALAADKAKMDKYYQWKKPGKDYYDMSLHPCGYKDGDTYYPLPNQIKSSNFAILGNQYDIDFDENIGISNLDENAKEINYLIRPVDDGEWGLNVILFRK
jgi:hypothetical protein